MPLADDDERSLNAEGRFQRDAEVMREARFPNKRYEPALKRERPRRFRFPLKSLAYPEEGMGKIIEETMEKELRETHERDEDLVRRKRPVSGGSSPHRLTSTQEEYEACNGGLSAESRIDVTSQEDQVQQGQLGPSVKIFPNPAATINRDSAHSRRQEIVDERRRRQHEEDSQIMRAHRYQDLTRARQMERKDRFHRYRRNITYEASASNLIDKAAEEARRGRGIVEEMSPPYSIGPEIRLVEPIIETELIDGAGNETEELEVDKPLRARNRGAQRLQMATQTDDQAPPGRRPQDSIEVDVTTGSASIEINQNLDARAIKVCAGTNQGKVEPSEETFFCHITTTCPRCHHFHRSRLAQIHRNLLKECRMTCERCGLFSMGLGRSDTQTSLDSQEQSDPIAQQARSHPEKQNGLRQLVHALSRFEKSSSGLKTRRRSVESFPIHEEPSHRELPLSKPSVLSHPSWNMAEIVDSRTPESMIDPDAVFKSESATLPDQVANAKHDNDNYTCSDSGYKSEDDLSISDGRNYEALQEGPATVRDNILGILDAKRSGLQDIEIDQAGCAPIPRSEEVWPTVGTTKETNHPAAVDQVTCSLILLDSGSTLGPNIEEFRGARSDGEYYAKVDQGCEETNSDGETKLDPDGRPNRSIGLGKTFFILLVSKISTFCNLCIQGAENLRLLLPSKLTIAQSHKLRQYCAAWLSQSFRPIAPLLYLKFASSRTESTVQWICECGQQLSWYRPDLCSDGRRHLAAYLDCSNSESEQHTLDTTDSSTNSDTSRTPSSQGSIPPTSVESDESSEGDVAINMDGEDITDCIRRRQRSPVYFELCINTSRFRTVLHEMNISNMKSDGELFSAIRDHHARRNSMRFRAWQWLPDFCSTRFNDIVANWSLRRPTSLAPKKFKVDSPRLIALCKMEMPPAHQVEIGNYRYRPGPLDEVMPDNIFVHLFNDPTSHYNAKWLPGVPQKLNSSIYESTEQLPVGWGMHIGESINERVILLTLFAGLLLSGLFVVPYAIIKKDVQGASGVGSYILALLGTWLGAMYFKWTQE